MPDLVRLLAAACFTTTCYLSGMRPGEALNLRRGCRQTDPETGQLLLQGRRGKGHGRLPWTGGDDVLARPWVVVAPVHAAVAMMERLAPHPLVFPASIVGAQARRSADTHARVSRRLTRDLEQFADWVNATFAVAGRALPIPPDPTKHIHPSRLRRTLAYFIVRRPRGLIAAALQYGHISTKVTLNYSGSADSSWIEDLAVERLELVLEQTDQDAALLDDGEHVSGPSAAEYRNRVARARRFAGRVVNQARNVQRILGQADSNIYHGEAMTSSFALRQAAVSVRNTQIKEELATLEKLAADPLAPSPIRDRAAAQAAQRHAIIKRHEQAHPVSIQIEEDHDDPQTA